MVFLCAKGSAAIKTGHYLGQMTNELEAFGIGCFGSEWICGGTKNYLLEVVNVQGEVVHTIMKIRGISLTYRNTQIINKQAMLDMVLNGADSVTTCEPHKIIRSKTYQIVSKPQNKIYRAIFIKRRKLDDRHTVPYGYICK